MVQQRHLSSWPKHLPRELAVPETSVVFNLEVSAARHPRKTALVCGERTLDYAQLLAAVRALAGYLHSDAGVGHGDRVLLCLQNCPEFVIAWYAILHLGAVVVPVSPMSVAEELAHYLSDSDARAAVIGADVTAAFRAVPGNPVARPIMVAYAGSDASSPDAIAWADALAGGVEPPPSRARADDLAAILYTSGTTGRPKGCMHSHRTIMTTLVGAVLWEGMTASSVALATAPFFHVTGMQHSMNAPIYTGGTIVMLPRWDADAAGALIERHGCTHWANVPTMVVDLLAHPATATRDLGSLQNIFGGGSAMPEAIAEKLFERCGIRYMEAYGMTETMSQSHVNPHQELRRQSLGIPTFGTLATVIDPDSLRELGPDEPGEIVISAPSNMLGYWRRDDANAEVFIELDGRRFIRTGDLGTCDAQGFFRIADRLKRMINAAGYKVWPAELESVLYRHPGIREVAVIAAPDARRGETVMAVVVPHEPGTLRAEDVIAWSREHMAAYKVPRRVEFTDALPRSGSGKILWRALQEKAWENAGRPGA